MNGILKYLGGNDVVPGSAVSSLDTDGGEVPQPHGVICLEPRDPFRDEPVLGRELERHHWRRLSRRRSSHRNRQVPGQTH